MQHFRALILSGAVLSVAVAGCTARDSLLDGPGGSGKGTVAGGSGESSGGSGGSTGGTGGSAGVMASGGTLGNSGGKGGGGGSVSTGGTGRGTTGGSAGVTDAGNGGTGGGSGEAGSGGTAGSGAAAGGGGAEQCPEGQMWCPGCTPGTGSCGPACTGAQCATCSEADTLEACEARPDCHSVFHDPGTCGCDGIGCCARFSGCAEGELAKCMGEPVMCDGAVPHCENPAFVISYRRDISCYEGCVQPKDCESACAATNDPAGCLCYSNADCAPGENCYSADCANQIAGVCTTPPPSGCFGDVDCPTGQTCIGGMPTGCNSTAPSITGTCGVEECAGGDCPGRSGPGCTCSDGEQCIEATGPLGSGACRTQDGTCVECMCAAPNTPIATPNGDRAIAELRPGDLVYSVDGEAIRAVPIVRINRTPVMNHRVLRVTFDNGRSIDMTAGHPLADGRPLSALRPGSELMGGIVVAVTSIPYTHDATYDILPLSTSGAYFASDVLVGSTLAGGSIGRRAIPGQLATK